MTNYYSVYIEFDASGSYARAYGTAGGKGSDVTNAFNNAPFNRFKTLDWPNNNVPAMRTWLQNNIFQGCALIASSGGATGENQWRADRGVLVRKGNVGLMGNVVDIPNAWTNFQYPSWAEGVRRKPILRPVHLNDLSENRNPVYYPKGTVR